MAAGTADLFNTASGHHQAGRPAQALPLYRRLRVSAPRDYAVLHLGGAALYQLGKGEEAVEWLERALREQPRAGSTRMLLGLALAQLGRAQLAEKQLREAVRLEPDNAEAWGNLAGFLVGQGQAPEAVELLRKAVALKPADAAAWARLGSALVATGRPAEALTMLDRSLALDPRAPHARGGRAQALYACHRLPEALADFAQAVAEKPTDHISRSFRLLLLHYTNELSPEQIAAEHCAFGQAVRPPRARVFPGPFAPDKRLRVAFLSPDLRNHSVAYFLEPLLRHLDRAAFEIVLYHDHFEVDATSERLRAQAVLWRNFIGQIDEVVEKQILADAPDVLIDLAGHTGYNRMALLARRLAPVQVNYLGYPNTTGLASMDFRFTDAVVDPVGASERLHTERLVRFAPTAWCYQPLATAPEVVPPPCSRADAAGAAGGTTTGVVFGSFNNLTKLTAETLSLWARVLAATPGSRLLLKGYAPQPERILQAAAAAGMDNARITLLPQTAGAAEHLACYHQMDIALDPFPYHGTTTTCEALWMGRPVITLAGDRHVSRVGVSLLQATGQGEGIAGDAEAYVAIAQRWAADPAGLAERSARLRGDLLASPLLDAAGQAERWGAALRQCWTTFAHGRSPA